MDASLIRLSVAISRLDQRKQDFSRQDAKAQRKQIFL
jgi:hypothetical protein